MSLPALQAGRAVREVDGGDVWPARSPVTDTAAGQIQAAYRRSRGRASEKTVSRALFEPEGAAPPESGADDEDVVAHAQGLEDTLRSFMARAARTRKAHVVSQALTWLSGDETAAAQLADSLERWHKRSDDSQLAALRAECEQRMRRVAATVRRQMQGQIKKAKKQEEVRVERARRASHAEVDTMQENARIALHDAEMEWSARVDALVQENGDLTSRLQSAEASLAKRQGDVQHEAELGQSTAEALRRQCSLLEKQLRHAESRIASQQRDLAAAEKDCAESKGRISALESSTAAAWAASYASSQKTNGRFSRPGPGTPRTVAAAAAAKHNTTSVVITLPSPSKLRSASSRSEMLGTSNSSSGPASSSAPPASPPRWRRDRFQVDTVTTAARSISGTVDTGSPLRPRVPSGLSARSNAAHTPGRARTGGSSARMTLGAQAPAVSSSMPVLPALASSGTAAVDDEMMAVPSAPRAGDASDVVGANDSRPVTRKFELPAAVKTSTMPPPSSRIVASGGSVGSEEPPMAVAPRTRRGADHLVDKLVNHFGSFDLPPVLGTFGAGLPALMQMEDLLRPHDPAKLAPLVVPPIPARSPESQRDDFESMQSSRPTAIKQHTEQEQERHQDASEEQVTDTHDGPSPIASDLSSPSVSPTDRCAAGRESSGSDGSSVTMAAKQFVVDVVKPGSTNHPLMAAPLASRPRFEPVEDILDGIDSFVKHRSVNLVLGKQPSVFQPRPPAAARSVVDGGTAVSAPQLHGRRRQFFSSRGTAVDGGTDDAPSAAAKLVDLRGGTGSARAHVSVPPLQTKHDVHRCIESAIPSGTTDATQHLMKPPPERARGSGERRGSVSKDKGGAPRVRRGSNVAAAHGRSEHPGMTQQVDAAQETRAGIGRLVGIATGTAAR